jgi:hypothetical protein
LPARVIEAGEGGKEGHICPHLYQIAVFYLQEWLSLERVGKRADLPSASWKELVQNIPTLHERVRVREVTSNTPTSYTVPKVGGAGCVDSNL